MGFTGTYVVARSVVPLEDHPSVSAMGGQPVWRASDGAWQVVQVLDGGEFDAALIAASGAPAIVASVMDSDVVLIDGRTPAGRTWEAVLSPEMARSYGFPEDMIEEPAEALTGAIAWAEEAGFQPNRDRLLRALTAEGDPLADDLVFDLLSALGLRFEEGVSLEGR